LNVPTLLSLNGANRPTRPRISRSTGRLTIGRQGKTTLVAMGAGARDYALNRRVEIQYSGPIDAQLSVRRQEGDLQLERPRPRAPAAGPRRTRPAPAVKRLR